MKKISSLITAFCLLVSLVFSTGSLTSFAATETEEFEYEGATLQFTKSDKRYGNGCILVSCSQLPDNGTLIIPESIEIDDKIYPVTDIRVNAFDSIASNLVSLELPNSVGSLLANHFNKCEKLESIEVYEVEKNSKSYLKSENGVLYSEKMDTLIAYPRAKKDSTFTCPANVKVIADEAFFRCNNLTEIILPETLTKIGNKSFARCSNLSEVKFPEGLESIGNYAFFNSNLSEIKFPENLKSIGDCAFFCCLNLKLMDTSKCSHVESLKVGLDIVSSCTKLKKIVTTCENIYSSLFESYTIFRTRRSQSGIILDFDDDENIVYRISSGNLGKLVDNGVMEYDEMMEFYNFLENYEQELENKNFRTPLTILHTSYIAEDDQTHYCEDCSELENEPHNFVNGVCTLCGHKENAFAEAADKAAKEKEDKLSSWGTKKTVSGIDHYVAADGTTSVEITGKNMTWLQEESYGSKAWYGLDNTSGIFATGSRFWVKWLNKEANPAEWQEYYNKLDDVHKSAVEKDNIWIFLVGVTDPDGKEYTNFGNEQFGKSLPFYIQFSDDWDWNQIMATFISSSSDEQISVSYVGNQTFPEGSANFARLALNHFSPYAVYDQLTDAEREEESATLVPSTESNTKSSSSSTKVKTGESNTALVTTAALALISASLLLALFLKRKKARK